MFDFITEAGFGIYPVIGFGLAAIGVAIRQFVAPRSGRLTTARWLMGLTAGAGIGGTVLGIQMSANHISQTPEKWIFLLGLKESLHNASVSVLLIMVASLILLAAHLKQGSKPLGVAAGSTRKVTEPQLGNGEGVTDVHVQHA